MRNFAAIDFETANALPTSVCSVGIVIVRDGVMVDSFYSLIKPEPEYYDFWCSQVHGLTECDTRDADVFPKVWARIAPRLEGLPLVAHNKAFDENCLRAVFRCYGMTYPDYEFYCTLQKSRRVWPCGRHNLDIIAERCGYNLTNHHHALADAEACAAIALKIFDRNQTDPYFLEPATIVLDMMKREARPIKACELAEFCCMERKVVDSAIRHLREDGAVTSPKRGYWIAKEHSHEAHLHLP